MRTCEKSSYIIRFLRRVLLLAAVSLGVLLWMLPGTLLAATGSASRNASREADRAASRAAYWSSLKNANAAGSSPTAVVSGNSADSTFWVEFIDVGQGDCALIQCDGHYMMIDGGPAKASSTVYTILKQKGIRQADCMIATHPDADHIGGLSGALNYAHFDTCYSPVTEHDTKTFQSLLKYLNKGGTELVVPSPGDSFALGSAEVTILGPIGSYGDTNNSSIVARVSYGDNSFLFMGDAETEEEMAILHAKQDLTSDVLKVGHHGSASSTSDQLLKKVKPAYAVISVGRDNSYGHPVQSTLDHLQSAGAQILRTDLQGDITIASDGEQLTVTTEKKADADSLLKNQTSGSRDASGVSAASRSASSGAGTTAQTAAAAGLAAQDLAADSASVQSSSGTDSAAAYVLNTRSHKFHLPGCSSVSDMSAKNRQDVTMSRDEIIAAGYDPCKRCNP